MNEQRINREIAGTRRCFRVLRDEGGQALVEFALVLPLLLMVTLAIVDFGRAWNVRQVVTDSARAGARVMVATSPVVSADSIKNIVNTAFASARLKAATVQEISPTATCPTPTGTAPIVCLTNRGGAPNSAASVSIVYPHRLQFLGPFMRWTAGQQNLILRSTFVMRNE